MSVCQFRYSGKTLGFAGFRKSLVMSKKQGNVESVLETSIISIAKELSTLPRICLGFLNSMAAELFQDAIEQLADVFSHFSFVEPAGEVLPFQSSSRRDRI